MRVPSQNGAFILPTTLIDSAQRHNKMFDIDCWVMRHALLDDLGVNYAQGFFVAKPKPAYPAILDNVSYELPS